MGFEMNEYPLIDIKQYESDLEYLDHSPETTKIYLFWAKKLLSECGQKPSEYDIKAFLTQHKGSTPYYAIMKLIKLYKLPINLPEKRSIKGGIRLRKVQEALTDVQVQQMGQGMNMRDRLMIDLLFYTGMRASELLNVVKTDFDASNNRLLVKGKGRGSEGKLRYVYLSEVINQRLNNYIQKMEGDGVKHTKIFPITRCRLYQVINRAGKINHIGHTHPHQLRHSYATYLLQKGLSIRLVQESLGHSRLDTTAIYTHVNQKELKRQIIHAFDE